MTTDDHSTDVHSLGEPEPAERTTIVALDDLKLGRAAERVLRLMLDGRRRTVSEISSALTLPSSSTSRPCRSWRRAGW
jgi:hypothetical protein